MSPWPPPWYPLSSSDQPSDLPASQLGTLTIGVVLLSPGSTGMKGSQTTLGRLLAAEISSEQHGALHGLWELGWTEPAAQGVRSSCWAPEKKALQCPAWALLHPSWFSWSRPQLCL